MGLLSKAEQSDTALGAMGDALAEQLLALPPNSQEKALNLLKAYGPFRCGACVALQGGSYVSYAAAGMGEAAFPALTLKAVPGKSWYSVDYTAPKIPAGTKFWVFPLEAGDTLPRAALLVGEDKNYIFQIEQTAVMIDLTGACFMPPAGFAVTEAAPASAAPPIEVEPAGEVAAPVEVEQPVEVAAPVEVEPVAVPAAPRKMKGGLLKAAMGDVKVGDFNAGEAQADSPLAQFDKAAAKYHVIKGLVIATAKSKDDFAGRVASRVSAFATVIPLKNGYCLVLGSEGVDYDLLSHRLARTVNSKKISLLNADNSQQALELVKAYL